MRAVKAFNLQPAASGFQVQQAAFEGPFELLIHLLERDKLDIKDIVLSDITQKYMESLKVLQQFDPDLASDFIYTAAWLLELKSRSLLPRVEREQLALQQQDDPREELIVRLMEYKRFKELAVVLEAKASGGYRVHARPPGMPDVAVIVPQLAPHSLDNLFSAYNRALTKGKKEVRELPARGMPVAERIEALRAQLAHGPAHYAELTKGMAVKDRIVTFLAMLELVRMGEIVVSQQKLFGPILLEMKRDANG